MTPATARVHALSASLEMRAGVDTPEAIIERAKKFETYIAADGLPEAGPVAGAQASQEKAGAGLRRR